METNPTESEARVVVMSKDDLQELVELAIRLSEFCRRIAHHLEPERQLNLPFETT